MLVYIHGFNSSALSHKAKLVGARMAELGQGDAFVCPELSHRPAAAMEQLERIVQADKGETALMGSSLGGFYATSLAERYGLRAVLVNPAVRPWLLLQQVLGAQRNLYTGAEYELTTEHLEELRQLEVPTVTPGRYLLITRTGDEVLDYRDAVEVYRGCEAVVVDGGDHGFGDFDAYVDRALAFCRIKT